MRAKARAYGLVPPLRYVAFKAHHPLDQKEHIIMRLRNYYSFQDFFVIKTDKIMERYFMSLSVWCITHQLSQFGKHFNLFENKMQTMSLDRGVVIHVLDQISSSLIILFFKVVQDIK